MLTAVKNFFRRLGQLTQRPGQSMPIDADSGTVATEPPAQQASTWQERAAAAGGLVEPGEKPAYTPIALSPNSGPVRRRRGSPKPVSFSENPLHLDRDRLRLFFAQDPRSIERYEAAVKTSKQLGTVDGRHFSSYLPDVKNLMASGDCDEVIGLLLRVVEASERQSDYAHSYMPPAWHAMLADAYIKAGRRDLAEAVNQRLITKQKPI